MEIAQLIISCSIPHNYVRNKICLMYGRSTHFGRAKAKGHTITMHKPPNQCPYKVSTSYVLQFPRYSLEKILRVKVTTAVNSRSHHDIAHLHPLTNVPTKYQLPTPYSL